MNQLNTLRQKNRFILVLLLIFVALVFGMAMVRMSQY